MSSSPGGSPLFVANNLALDFINTEYGVGHRHCDCFEGDGSVAEWLKLAGVLPANFAEVPAGLAALARELRENARAVVLAAKTGSPADAAVINRVLESGRPRKELVWDPAQKTFRVVEHRRDADAASLLEPVARALASLLADVDLQLVRECEAHDCTLFFHDQTKSHRRRWCSMATCGNRMKAAAHRARKSVD
ncbi:CGNR zinc finger domain-containing protein [Bordetella genomosp. 13]|uniref:Zinc finger CGNR domain-containing protein n=1 Tax=Bordetella genomosp. 13 TaxID=463040 RepID=A0A1W6Z932_9BORD|nr:ABATE domain-containing protein [Bordetella genomosp. 13]ARP93762.1 hypothetical protein CAL15_04820 [Bordetella genomosp. 13]